MKTSKVFTPIIVSFLLILLLSACSGGQTESQSVDESAVEAVSEPIVEPTMEQASEPAPEPTPLPEIEPEIIDLGHDARLLVRGLPEGVVLDAKVDLEMKDSMPATRNYDYVQTEIVVINITHTDEPTTLDKGVVELCYTTEESKANLAQPKPYYWDTSITPLVDGRGFRVSTQEKEPDLVICAMVQASGAYAVVAP